MRGRKPKPTQLKILQGNPGGKKLNENEPQPKGPLFNCPEWFDQEQKALWAFAINNAPEGVLGISDREILTVWVVASITHRRAAIAQAKVDADASLPMLTKNKAGNIQTSPYVQIMNTQSKIMIQAASELGFSPSARARLSVDKKTLDSPFSKFGNG